MLSSETFEQSLLPIHRQYIDALKARQALLHWYQALQGPDSAVFQEKANRVDAEIADEMALLEQCRLLVDGKLRALRKRSAGAETPGKNGVQNVTQGVDGDGDRDGEEQQLRKRRRGSETEGGSSPATPTPTTAAVPPMTSPTQQQQQAQAQEATTINSTPRKRQNDDGDNDGDDGYNAPLALPSKKRRIATGAATAGRCRPTSTPSPVRRRTKRARESSSEAPTATDTTMTTDDMDQAYQQRRPVVKRRKQRANVVPRSAALGKRGRRSSDGFSDEERVGKRVRKCYAQDDEDLVEYESDDEDEEEVREGLKQENKDAGDVEKEEEAVEEDEDEDEEGDYYDADDGSGSDIDWADENKGGEEGGAGKQDAAGHVP